MKLNTNWKTSLITPSGNKHDITMFVNQTANMIEGEFKAIKTLYASNKVEIKSYEMKGEIIGKLLLLSGKNKNKQKSGVQAELLKILDSGKTLKGKILWSSATNNDIESMDIEWHSKSR